MLRFSSWSLYCFQLGIDLAPPLHTARDYSMGVVGIEHTNPSHALIEARGYANLELGEGVKITIDNFTALLGSEEERFFDLSNRFTRGQEQ